MKNFFTQPKTFKLTNKDGRKVISSVIEDFKKITKRLEDGVNLCEEKENKHNEEIKNLNAEIKELNTSKEQAKKLISNLTALLS